MKKTPTKQTPPKKSRSKVAAVSSTNRSPLAKRLGLVLTMLAVVVTGISLTTGIFANPSDRAFEAVKPFVEDKARGLVWAGLEKNESLCPVGFLVGKPAAKAEENACTHGPDPADIGQDITKSVEPLANGVDESITAASTAGIVCDGDGVSGNRIQFIYARANDKPDRYSTYQATFQSYVANMNKIFVESGNQSGSPRSMRIVTDANCNVSIPSVVLSATGDDTFANTKSELAALGFNRSDRKYQIWMDATVYCGIGTIRNDSQLGQANANNRGQSYGRTDSGCWGGAVETHEYVHNLGGVQNDSPHTSGGYHCNDNYDRMCYADGGTKSLMQTVCTDSAQEYRLDCNKDDYFNTSSTIDPTNYLSNHWNVAASAFLLSASPTSTVSPTPTPTPAPTDTVLPTVSLSSPIANSVISNKTTIVAAATDNVGISKLEFYIDNKLVSTSTNSSARYNWNTRKTSTGQHSITVKAYDTSNNTNSASMFVIK